MDFNYFEVWFIWVRILTVWGVIQFGCILIVWGVSKFKLCEMWFNLGEF